MFLLSCPIDSTLKVWNLESHELVYHHRYLKMKILKLSTLCTCSGSGLIGNYDLKNDLRETAKYISDDLSYFLQVSKNIIRRVCRGVLVIYIFWNIQLKGDLV